MKEKFKIVDCMFAHSSYSTDFQESKYIEWDRSMINLNDEDVFYTDYSLDQVNINIKNRFAWLLESPDITADSHRWIATNNNLFITVLTSNKECWIKTKDHKIYEKSKKLSIVASAKRMTHGHVLRHQIIQYFNNDIDIYGRIYNPIEYKLDGLKDYAFSLTIENTKKDYYFTEKLIDCFMTGTVPIYWGCPSIGNFFNTDGMIIFDNINDLQKILDGLSFEKYNNMIDAIADNFEKAKEYLIAEDYIYKNYIKNNK